MKFTCCRSFLSDFTFMSIFFSNFTFSIIFLSEVTFMSTSSILLPLKKPWAAGPQVDGLNKVHDTLPVSEGQ